MNNKRYKVTFYIPWYCLPIYSSKRSVECNQMDMIKYVSRQELDERYVLKVEEIKSFKSINNKDGREITKDYRPQD